MVIVSRARMIESSGVKLDAFATEINTNKNCRNNLDSVQYPFRFCHAFLT